MQITNRDLEIVGFILNMKFASVTDIHQKFFKVKRDGGISTSEWYARERLRELAAYGLSNFLYLVPPNFLDTMPLDFHDSVPANFPYVVPRHG